MKMNLPNKLTMARMIMVPIFILFLLINTNSTRIIACIIFCIASITDLLDGKIARKYNQVTNFGKIMDPLADKLLVLSALIVLVQLKDAPSWIVILIVGRDLAITSLRSLAAAEGIIIAASKWGKWKTTVQMIALIFLIIKPTIISIIHFNIGLVLLYIALALTLYSGYDYFAKMSKQIQWS